MRFIYFFVLLIGLNSETSFAQFNFWSGNVNRCSTVRKNCLQHLQAGCKKDGNYLVRIEGIPTTVLCDMTTSGGGWTLVFKDQSDNSDNGTKNYMSQSSTAIGVPTSAKYKLNTLNYPHSGLMFKAKQLVNVANFTDAYVLFNNKQLKDLTGTSDSSCGPLQFDNSGCELSATTFDYYSYTGGSYTNPSNYWFGDTVSTSSPNIFVYYSTAYKYIWMTTSSPGYTAQSQGTVPTTILRSIWVR